MRADDKISPEELLAFARNLNIGLTSGYIGNLERWGDDRLFCVWAGQETLWSAEAKNCTRRDVSDGFQIVKPLRQRIRSRKTSRELTANPRLTQSVKEDKTMLNGLIAIIRAQKPKPTGR